VTKPEVIQELQKCTWLDQACRNIGGTDWQELRQEFWLRIFEAKEAIFPPIRDVRFYSVKVLQSIQFKSNREIDRYSGTLSQDEVQDTDYTAHQLHDLKDAILNRLPFYERVLFQLHEKGMSYRKISVSTRIDRGEVSMTLNKVKKILKNKYLYPVPCWPPSPLRIAGLAVTFQIPVHFGV